MRRRHAAPHEMCRQLFGHLNRVSSIVDTRPGLSNAWPATFRDIGPFELQVGGRPTPNRHLHPMPGRNSQKEAASDRQYVVGSKTRYCEPKDWCFAASNLLATAAFVLGISAAANDCRAQGVDDPLTAQQFINYEQGGADSLTNSDLQYLLDNQIRIPNDLSKVQIGGLHRVINESKTQKDAGVREKQVNYYLDLAVEQTIHCAISPNGANCDKAK